jgi:pyruvate/2-oxoglutarate dehydrogenase complex dihydrolipoamide dehydrogenase (E3) component/uncharacterized membrane protein YdjX (TVP38/TMEM64 family)
MSKSKKIKIMVILALSIMVIILLSSGVLDYLSFHEVKKWQADFLLYAQAKPFKSGLIYFIIYILVTSLSLPGAAILTLLGGGVFGFWKGLLLVSFASTIGATLAFLIARYLLRDLFAKKFSDSLKKIDQGIEKEGVYYLFSIRMIPLFPFFMVNVLMGLTKIPVLTFAVVSQVGMLIGTALYVNAGRELANLTSTQDILSRGIIISLVLIGIAPLFLKKIMNWYKSKKIFSKFKKPNTFDYNIIVIGAGSAGLVTSYIAAAVKAKVALIERERMGGDCLNTGCVPSKALIKSAKIVSVIKEASKYGVEVGEPQVHFRNVMKRVKNAIKTIEPHDSMERYRGLGVDCFQGEAKILSPWEVQVGSSVLTCKSIVVATGARPFIPPIDGLAASPYLTSETLWDLEDLPTRLCVLGGGPIGCELAQAFARLGSQVTLIEAHSRLMMREESEASTLVEQALRADGVELKLEARAQKIEKRNGEWEIDIHQNDQIKSIKFDRLLLAVGRSANITGFGLEELGVEIDSKGTISHDDFLRTNYPNIFVCGDVAGPYQFTHTASHQAWFASVNALFGDFKKFKVDYRVIPWCTFTDPEVARVGASEKELEEAAIDYQVSTYEIKNLDRAITDAEQTGYIKVLTRGKTDKILGVTIVASRAGDLISEFVTNMKFNLGLNKLLSTIHIYPTYMEANKFTAGVWKKQNISQKVLKLLTIYHRWKRR